MNIFTPAIKLLNQLTYSQKISFLATIVISVIVFLSYSLYLQLNKVIIDSKTELVGIEEIIEVNQLIQLSQQYRGLSLAKSNGNSYFTNLHQEKEIELTTAYHVIFNNPDLTIPLFIEKESLTDIENLWGKIKSLGLNESILIHYKNLTHFIFKLQALNLVSSEHYLLMTDKDIASSYLIEMLLHDIPNTSEHMGKIRALVLGVLSDKVLTMPQRRKLTLAEANLEHSMNNFDHNIKKVIHYSPELTKDLTRIYLQLTKEKQKLVKLLKTDIYNEKLTTDAHYFWLEMTTTIDSLYELMRDPIVPDLKNHINKRIAKSLLDLKRQIIIAISAFIFMLYFMMALSKALKNNIHHISKVVNDYAKGNSTVRIKLHTRDEMREISIAINNMAIKLTESQKQRIFQQQILDEHAIVSMCDAEGNITYANDNFININQHSREELIGINHRIVKSDFHPPEFYQNLWDTITKGNIWHGDIKNKAKDGSTYWVTATIAPYVDIDAMSKNPTQYLAIRTDISKIKAFEEKQQEANDSLKKEREKAEKANLAKSEFLSSMSHELRTPLNAILGFAQILNADSQNPLTDHQKQSMGYILSSGEHLLNLINDVLSLLAIEAGNTEFSLEPLQLDQLLESTLILLTPLANKAQITLEILSNSSVTVNADYTKLKQVIINLISNAIKYNHPKGKIFIELKQVENNYVKLKIIDTGIGISTKNQRKLFNAFNRLGQENSTIEGTGIGLIVTKELIEKMKGRIGFESVEHKGSTFWIELPVITETLDSKTSLENDLVKEDTTKLSTLLLTKRILYVEDNPTNRNFMQAFFETRKFNDIIMAETGEIAWDMVMQEKFDLILMDINLPNMNGKDLTKKLRATNQYKNTPILAVSAAVMKHNIDSVEGLFNAYITKPIIISELSAALEKYLS